jgi:hypothetical protein
MIMKRFLIFGFLVGLSIGVSLPLEGASEKPKRGGTVTMAIRRGFHPTVSSLPSSFARV